MNRKKYILYGIMLLFTVSLVYYFITKTNFRSVNIGVGKGAIWQPNVEGKQPIDDTLKGLSKRCYEE